MSKEGSSEVTLQYHGQLPQLGQVNGKRMTKHSFFHLQTAQNIHRFRINFKLLNIVKIIWSVLEEGMILGFLQTVTLIVKVTATSVIHTNFQKELL